MYALLFFFSFKNYLILFCEYVCVRLGNRGSETVEFILVIIRVSNYWHLPMFLFRSAFEKSLRARLRKVNHLLVLWWWSYNFLIDLLTVFFDYLGKSRYRLWLPKDIWFSLLTRYPYTCGINSDWYLSIFLICFLYF